MDALVASLRSDAHAAPPADEPNIRPIDWQCAYARAFASIEAGDLIEQLGDVGELLLAAAARGDANTVGRIVINVQSAYAGRLADQDVFGRAMGSSVSNEQAAAAACLGAKT